MEFDPLSRDIAPPRHEIESDSEDESNTASQSGKTFTPPKIHLLWHNQEATTGSELIIFQSEGGEAFLRSQSYPLKEIAKVMINEEQHGSLALTHDKKKKIVMLLRPSIKLLGDQSSLNYICLPILNDLKPSKLTIVDDYNPSLYITSKDVMEDPIRYISTHSKTLRVGASPGIDLFETPNYILGLAAAMINESGILGIPSTILLLPRAVNPHLQSWSRIQANSLSLDTQPDPLLEELASCLASILSFSNSNVAKDSNTTLDILDYLHIRRSKARKTMAQSVSAMYV